MRRLSIVIAAVVWAAPLQAGNVGAMARSGQPVRWRDGGRGIAFQVDQGPLGPFDPATATSMARLAFRRWEEIPTATISFVDEGSLPFDADAINRFDPPFGSSAVIFDADGSLFADYFGPDSGILSFTLMFHDEESGDVFGGSVLLNGAGAAEMPHLTLGLMVHEVGHLAGLGHSVVNGQMALLGDHSGPSPHDTFSRPPSFEGLIETMYPYVLPFLSDAGIDSPAVDDVAAISALYPEPHFAASTGTITGRIVRVNGTPASGLNVIARNLDDPFGDAVAGLSGIGADPLAGSDPRAGVYTLPGLKPGGRYAVYVDSVVDVVFVPPVVDSFTVPLASLAGAPEELYNGADESHSSERIDDPSAFSPLEPQAGQTVGGIDILLNRPLPGPLSLGPWDAIEIPLRFPFPMCGRTHNSVWVNSNGTLTFGEPTHGAYPRAGHDFLGSPPVRRLLFGPPAIAPLWTALYPPEGEVGFEETPSSVTVTFDDVPYAWDRDSRNTFRVTIDSGGTARIDYGSVSTPVATAGYSCGAGVTSGMETAADFSALPAHRIRGRGLAALYEPFDNVLGRPFDLSGRGVTVELPGAFVDAYEPNDAPASAAHVQLPFHTARSYAELVEGDVDYYRFRARAGEIVVVETHPGLFEESFQPRGTPDTRLGLFSSTKHGTALLAANDDAWGTFSRVILTAPADGEYVVAVTSAEDEEFLGAGPRGGRYVLSIAAYRGRVLDLRQYDTLELPLPFPFAFQGRVWSSVWVNTLGSLTFGEGDPLPPSDTSFLADFLAGPPRIAPLMGDLAVRGGQTHSGKPGLLIVDERSDAVTVRWVTVPFRPNLILGEVRATFAATLLADGGVRMSWDGVGIEMDDYQFAWEDVVSLTGIAPVIGITEGRGAPALGSVDLTTVRNGPAVGTIYQHIAKTRFQMHFDEVRLFRPAAFVEAPRQVSGAGRNGTLQYDVSFAYTGPFAVRAHGLVAPTPHTGSVVDDPRNSFFLAEYYGLGVTPHELIVPPGTIQARFALFDDHTDGNDDLDLYVMSPDGVRSSSRTRRGSTEVITLDFPTPGTYSVLVHGFQTDGPDASYTLFQWNVGAEVSGNLTADATAQAVSGTTAPVTIAWSGLTGGVPYVGAIGHHSVASPATPTDGLLRLTLVEVDPDQRIVAPVEVAGSGTTGTLRYPIHFGYSGAFAAMSHGLVPARTDLASVVDDPHNRFSAALRTGVGVKAHTIDIPVGAVHARFALFDRNTDGHHDLDLHVRAPDGAIRFVSGGVTSQEEVRLDNPAPGTYTVYVHGYETEGPQATYTLFLWILGPEEGSAPLSVAAPDRAVEGQAGIITLGWPSLSPATRYLGRVSYVGDASGSTLVRVDP